jgi:hypothetical protein
MTYLAWKKHRRYRRYHNDNQRKVVEHKAYQRVGAKYQADNQAI